jgi:hypothetical protein
MALVAATLTQALAAIAPTADPTAAAQAWSAAYAGYAAAATDVSLDPVAAVNRAGFTAKLTSLFTTTGNVSPATAAQAFGDAFVAYWTGATFATLIPPAPGTPGIVGGDLIFSKEVSSVVTVASSTTLVTALQALFAAPTGDTATRDDAVAQAFHAATQAVVVLITGIDTTVPTPLPITCTNTIL